MSSHLIEINHLSFSYPDGRRALHDVSLAVGTGEKVAVVGPNGAGKSTLFLHLNGTLGLGSRNGSRVLRVAGHDVGRGTLRAVRARVGLIFQDPDDQLFSSTVFEDVAFGPLHLGLDEGEVRQRVARALDAVGMAGHEKLMPHHMSLGERKRISIATVLAMEPEILVLDEPSAGLDPRARRNLIALLGDLSQTMLVASHDMRLVWDLCPRTIVLDGGRLVADGATPDLLQDADLMDRHGLEVPYALSDRRPRPWPVNAKATHPPGPATENASPVRS
jgi:cobalt/nickel transport system ATP-binding protein